MLFSQNKKTLNLNVKVHCLFATEKKSFRRSLFLNWRVNEQPVLYTYIGIIT